MPQRRATAYLLLTHARSLYAAAAIGSDVYATNGIAPLIRVALLHDAIRHHAYFFQV